MQFKKEDVQDFLYRHYEDKKTNTIKIKKPQTVELGPVELESPNLGRKSHSVLEQEVELYREQVECWKKKADKFYREKRYLYKQLQREKIVLFKELWSFRILFHFVGFLRLRGFIGLLLLFNLCILLFVVAQMKEYNSEDTENLSGLHLGLNNPYTIQVDNLSSFDDAKKVVALLKRKKFNAYIGKIYENDRDVYRIYVEEFKDLKQAYKRMKLLKKHEHFQDSFVRRKY